MGIYSTRNGKLSYGQAFKNELNDFPGCGIAKAKIIVKSTGETQQVQFNPQTLTFTGSVTTREIPQVATESTGVVNIFAKPTITMTLDLLFDALNDGGLVDHLAGGNFLRDTAMKIVKTSGSKMANGSKIFPVAYGDVSQQVDFFYNIMTIYKWRRVEFAWNQLSFVGDVETISVNVLLFDTSGKPTRAKISLTIKQEIAEQLDSTRTIPGIVGKLTRK